MNLKPSDALKVYRASSKEDRKTVVGSLIISEGKHYIQLRDEDTNESQDYLQDVIIVEIIPESLTIFIGKFDKNNVPIFASLVDSRGGDRMAHAKFPKESILSVKFSNKHLYFFAECTFDNEKWALEAEKWDNAEVIGNQFQGDSDD